ncbi:hypothetical protein [Sphingobacterium sp. LRF_L2]|uniref:hypothetical protein n=1 Tax=Sphingobacterium sp. LRF_L2 TaxID=3369421 RepID=UPI003F61940B
MEDPKDATELLMEESALLYGAETTPNFTSSNPLNDKFSIILFPSLVYAARYFCSSENEIYQYVNRVIDREFVSFLEHFDPLYKCTGFIDYHMLLYTGKKSDYIKHIKYQIIPLIRAKKSNSEKNVDYDNLESIVTDWVQEKSSINLQPRNEDLLNAFINVCLTFLDNVPLYRKFKDENKYNTVISALINQRLSNKSWTAKDQSLGGSSITESEANRAGLAFRDIIISDNLNNNISAIECFRLYSIPKQQNIDSCISSHLTKMFANEPLGLSPLFVIVYCETKSFTKSWNKYLNYYRSIDFGKYKSKSIQDISGHQYEAVNLKTAKAVHNREKTEIIVYHLFINMYP